MAHRIAVPAELRDVSDGAFQMIADTAWALVILALSFLALVIVKKVG